MKRWMRAALLALLLVTPGVPGHAQSPQKAVTQSPDLVHYLLLGFDFWGDETIGVSYSDTNMLASIDRAGGRLMITSLLRDTYVQKPDGKSTRLNNVVRREGFDVMLGTVSLNYGVEVNKYMAIGVQGMRDLIDAIGGVQVTLTGEEATKLREHVKGVNGSGTYTLDSGDTMHYMRLRKASGHDIARTERQRKVLTEVMNKVRTLPPTEIAALGMRLFESVETNMTLADVLEAVSMVYSFRDAPLELMRIPIDGSYKNVERHGMAVYELDWTANREALRAFLAGPEGSSILLKDPDATYPPVEMLGPQDASTVRIKESADGETVPDPADILPEKTPDASGILLEASPGAEGILNH